MSSKQKQTKQKSRKRTFWKEVKFIIANFNNLNFKAEYSKLDVSILLQKRNLVLNWTSKKPNKVYFSK